MKLPFTPDNIAFLLRGELPGYKSHIKMDPSGGRINPDIRSGNNIRHGSVLLPLFIREGKVFASLIKRSLSITTHPGQISLPGGRIETGESPEYAALREASEEIGISPADVRMLGRLSALFLPASNYTIIPHVGWIERDPVFVPCLDEVEKIIMFPIQQCREKREIKHTVLNTSFGMAEVPYYDCENEIVWGATAMILTEFLDVMENGEMSSVAGGDG